MKHEDVWKNQADAESAEFIDDVLLFFSENKDVMERFENWRKQAAQAVQTEYRSLTINAKQLREALCFVNPDHDDVDQLESEITFFERKEDQVSTDGDPLPKGIYCYLTEYPDEGCYGPLGTLPPVQSEINPEECLKGLGEGPRLGGLTEKPYVQAEREKPVSQTVGYINAIKAKGMKDQSKEFIKAWENHTGLEWDIDYQGGFGDSYRDFKAGWEAAQAVGERVLSK